MPFGFGFFAAGAGGAAPSFEHIETITPPGNTFEVTVSGLSSYAGTYKHLQVRIQMDLGISFPWLEIMRMRVNGDTSASYANNLMTQASSRTINNTLNEIGALGMPGVIDIIDPFSTSKHRTFRTIFGAMTNNRMASARFYKTDVLNSLTFFSEYTSVDGKPILSSSRISIYGVK